MLAAQERERTHALARFEAEKADLQQRINALTAKAERKRPAPVPSDPYTPTRRRIELEPPSEERRAAPERSLSIQDTDRHKDMTWNPIIEESKAQTAEHWFRNCKDQHLKTKEKALKFVEEQKYIMCLEVVNSAYPQNHPHRKEAAHMFAQSARTAGVNEGTSEHGALVTFYKFCCVKVHGEPQPPEAEVRKPASQTGALAVTAKDFTDFGKAISSIMSDQVKDTLSDAANLFEQQHKAGPADSGCFNSGPRSKHQVLPAEPHRHR